MTQNPTVTASARHNQALPATRLVRNPGMVAGSPFPQEGVDDAVKMLLDSGAHAYVDGLAAELDAAGQPEHAARLRGIVTEWNAEAPGSHSAAVTGSGVAFVNDAPGL